MKTRLIPIVAALTAMFALASCEQEQPEVFNVGLSQSSYSIGPDGGEIFFAISANVAWQIKSTESWLNVTPSAHARSDKEENAKVTVTIAPNDSYTERKATVSISSPGSGESSFQVVQSGRTRKTINVTDKSGQAVSEIDAVYLGDELEIIVKSSSESIDVSSAADWVTTTTGRYKAGVACTVTLGIAPNTGADRSAEVTISGRDVEAPVTVTIKQNGKTSVRFTGAEANYHKCQVEVTAAKETDLIALVYTGKESFDKRGTDGVAAYRLDQINSYLKQYGEAMVSSALLGQGTARQTLYDLEPETQYYIVAFAVVFSKGKYEFASDPVCQEIATTARPEDEKEYSGLIGSYTLYGNVVKIDGDIASVGKEISFPLTIEEDDVNESYRMTIPDNDFNPLDTGNGKTYVDSFTMEYHNGADGQFIRLPLPQDGDQGATWSFSGVSGYCKIVLEGYDITTVRQENGHIDFGWNEGMTSLTQIFPANRYMIATKVVAESGEGIGRYSEYIAITSIEKKAEAEKKAAGAERTRSNIGNGYVTRSFHHSPKL